MKPAFTLVTVLLLFPLDSPRAATTPSEPAIRWLAEYRADTLPQEQGWTPLGNLAGKAATTGKALRILDDSAEDLAAFRKTWKAEPEMEIVAEVRLRVGRAAPEPGKKSTLWPSRDGAPIGVRVSDGTRQGGLVLEMKRISSFYDRRFNADTRDAFHTYRLVINGRDMSVEMDGRRVIIGEGAFWKPAESPQPFIEFGATAKTWTSDAAWEYVKLGVRQAAPPPKPALKITISEPWEILPPGSARSTRPYLEAVGDGLLMLSVGQGPDKFYEPYGVFRSTDEGRTWTPVDGLQLKSFAPLPFARAGDGGIIGVSRWNIQYAPGTHVGMSHRFDRAGATFAMFENQILMPKETPAILVFDHNVISMGGGVLLVAAFDKGEKGNTTHVLRSTDEGKTWRHFSTIGAGGEPAIARLAENKLMAMIRHNPSLSLHQHLSEDGGKTWGVARELEVGYADPDLIRMSNGVLACSYGRPGNNLMFSLDEGRTWTHHIVLTDQMGFNYGSLREVRPGRLLVLFDAPKLQGVYVDVERVNR
jgi:hypothetical protein